jgi:hypothetical protein
MKLSPQAIMVRAASHPNRSAFTDANPGEFDRINQVVMSRADEPAAGLGIIDTARSEGQSWREIIGQFELPHMALLRNLIGIFSEIDDASICTDLMRKLKEGVQKGRQFPFRYWSVFKAIGNAEVHHKAAIMNTLEECVDVAARELPKLKGRTMCLSDNSRSAWGAFNSEYGRITVAEIDNLSGVVTALNSEEGYVGKFGDKLIVTPILESRGLLSQNQTISEKRCDDVGGSTENGIWIFFDNAIGKREHWDNIFIYSDMQAGHGGLYGTEQGIMEYSQKDFSTRGTHVDVAKLIAKYRGAVNSKVNVFCVQTAEYSNISVPEYGYRTNLMYGWTGKEILFAKIIADFWNEVDEKSPNK